MTASDILTIAPILLVIPGIIPVIRQSHQARINLSVWAVITANSWLAAAGTLFASEQGTSGIYLLLNALLLSPVFFSNLRKGVWGELPAWHKASAFILPLGTSAGLFFGGAYATWSACLISLLLTIQLMESTWKSTAREHLVTWSWFLAADSTALFFGWADSNSSFRVLMSLWVFQCLSVITIELHHRFFQSDIFH
jgi:uncharacterized membrane protein